MATATNKDFADSNEKFRELCKKAGCEPTARQASKFKNEYGRAYKLLRGIALSRSKR